MVFMICRTISLSLARRVVCISLARRTISISPAREIMSPPDRWDVYQPLGSIIPGTKFIAFKVPLKEEMLKQVEEKDRFSPAILMKLISEKGLKLGGIIDLTFTFKYYNREEFLKNSVGHKKIFTPGHAVPSEKVFQEFAHAVKSFDAVGHDHIIGVHCTHGVNRTGYLICRYMIEEMDYEPDDAITLFGEARGHVLERDNYLQDLRSRKRGQSSFDPNFKVQNEGHKTARDNIHHNPQKEKPRWRHHREDHPEWRRNYHHSSQDRISDSSNSSVDMTGNIHQENSHHRNDWHRGDTRSGYFVDRNGSVDTSAHHRSHLSAHRSSNPNWRDKSSGYNPHYDGFNPNWEGQDRRSYYGHIYDPSSSHRGAYAERGRMRRDGHRPHHNVYD